MCTNMSNQLVCNHNRLVLIRQAEAEATMNQVVSLYSFSGTTQSEYLCDSTVTMIVHFIKMS